MWALRSTDSALVREVLIKLTSVVTAWIHQSHCCHTRVTSLTDNVCWQQEWRVNSGPRWVVQLWVGDNAFLLTARLQHYVTSGSFPPSLTRFPGPLWWNRAGRPRDRTMHGLKINYCSNKAQPNLYAYLALVQSARNYKCLTLEIFEVKTYPQIMVPRLSGFWHCML